MVCILQLTIPHDTFGIKNFHALIIESYTYMSLPLNSLLPSFA